MPPKNFITPYGNPKGATVLILLLLGVATNVSLAETTENSLSGEISVVEVMPNPDGTDTKDNEYLKLKNNSDQLIDLTGWKICNINNDCYSLKGEITSNNCLKIWRSEFIFTLHNDKEKIELFDPSGTLLDQVDIGTATSGQAWLCDSGFCSWGSSRETCDYTDLIVVEENSPETTVNSSENTNNNQATSSDSSNNFPNGNDSVQAKIIDEDSFQIINSKEDWAKAKIKMKDRNLLSLPTSLEGKIVAPYNTIKDSTLYLKVFGELVLVNVYASRRPEFSSLSALYQKGTIVNIQNGFLKNIQSNWQIGVGKGTELTILKEAKDQSVKNNRSFLKINEIDWSKPAQYEGKKIQIKGQILKKSGNYFFLENTSQPEYPITVYASSLVWNQYLNREKISLFPSSVQSTAETNNYKGRILKAVGNIEISGNSYRILIIDSKDLSIEANSKDIASKKDNAEKISVKKENNSEDKISSSNSSQENTNLAENNLDQAKNKKIQEKIMSQKNILAEAKKILFREKLAEKMSWFSLTDNFVQLARQKLAKIFSFFV